ncbi:MAG: 1-acyl-sn-glycerol-3-phosphate acyltransferase [Verrucomicrobia subdivision 3 bacterium]|nr:1-acyl-sn-glycerol-3-phosphate acyltransferase [Limisphaerales bacterium]
MNRFCKCSSRVIGRIIWLGGELVFALITFVALTVTQAGIPSRAVRALWLQRICQRALRIFRIRLSVVGPVPSRGLLVCNHLSYLDILVLAATTPCIFVSKCEIKRWPVFGWLASLAGTLFLRRDKRSDVVRISREMRHVMDEGGLVVLFPEGTTSDGREVLPFKSSLFELATHQPHALSAGFVEYVLSDGDVAEEVCYWKDMTMLPHLLNLFSKGGVDAQLRFAKAPYATGNRKDLARHLHAEVLRLKALPFKGAFDGKGNEAGFQQCCSEQSL